MSIYTKFGGNLTAADLGVTPGGGGGGGTLFLSSYVGLDPASTVYKNNYVRKSSTQKNI